MSVENRENARLVYSSEGGRIRDDPPSPPSGPPGDGVVRVGRTRAGRKGKTVTLVTGVPQADLGSVGRELKRVCGSGGAVKDGVIEIQGDHRDRVVAHLEGRYRIRRTGG
jgi:translation initiation factor 1